jgi:tRNA U34 5-methylaminomethyl-2-thiouridine-forming methyltransferase MnmC
MQLNVSLYLCKLRPVRDRYQLVQLANGAHSVRSLEHDETFHPVIGPVAEARALYVEQLALPQRIAEAAGEFVVWDVGLGAAANPLTLLNHLRPGPGRLRIVSFDRTTDPLRFALSHPAELPFIAGWEGPLRQLLEARQASFGTPGGARVEWTVHVAEFPALIHSAAAEALPKPNAIFFDAYSPATNPEMWTLPLFTRICELLDPARPCAMPTYSRSTLLRTTLLLAGFYVGRGQATGEKEETTIAANAPELIREPLGEEWLKRARRSTSAEPLRTSEYRQAPLSGETWERLTGHRQFTRSS